MSLVEAKLYFSILHYIICISIMLFICLYKTKSLFTFVYKLYGCIGGWALICYILDGCPITMLENVLSLHLFGQPFYTNYGFHATDIKYLLGWPILYYPLGVVLLMTIVKYASNKYEGAS